MYVYGLLNVVRVFIRDLLADARGEENWISDIRTGRVKLEDILDPRDGKHHGEPFKETDWRRVGVFCSVLLGGLLALYLVMLWLQHYLSSH